MLEFYLMERTLDKKNGINRFYRKEQGPLFLYLLPKSQENLSAPLSPQNNNQGPMHIHFYI